MTKSQKEKVLKVWIREQTKHPFRFFYGYEFINNGEFIGYKAPTRFCELCDEYKSIQWHLEGKYKVGRLDLQNMEDIYRDYPELRQVTELSELVQRKPVMSSLFAKA